MGSKVHIIDELFMFYENKFFFVTPGKSIVSVNKHKIQAFLKRLVYDVLSKQEYCAEMSAVATIMINYFITDTKEKTIVMVQ